MKKIIFILLAVATCLSSRAQINTYRFYEVVSSAPSGSKQCNPGLVGKIYSVSSGGAIYNVDSTGACVTLSFPATYYQTVQVSGVAQTQRPKLNLIPGSGTTIACVDNSSNSSTDCTVTSTGSSGSVHYTDQTGTYNFDADNTNASGHLVTLYASGQDTSGSHAMMMQCSVDGALISTTQVGATTAGGSFTVQCDVPAGSTWHITTYGSGGFTTPSKAKIMYGEHY